MTTTYLVRAREYLEDDYLGRPIDIVEITDDKTKAQNTYKKYVLASISDIDVSTNIQANYPEDEEQYLALQRANEYALAKENHALLNDDGCILEYYGLPENFSDDCVVEVAEMLGISTLQFDEIKNPSYVVYFPEIDEYLYYQDEFPDEDFYTIIGNAELAFGHQPDFIFKDDRIPSVTKNLIKAFIDKMPKKIVKDSIDELTHSPDEFRTLMKTLEDDITFTETENGVHIKIYSSGFYTPKEALASYKKYAQINALLKSPLFIEKTLSPDELIMLYKKSLERINDYYESIYGNDE